MRWILLALVASCTVEIGDDATDSEADGDDAAQTDDVNALLSGGADAPTATAAVATDDRDGDGISDATEELLLRRYRPYYKWSSNESYGPANPVEEIRNAQLRTANVGGGVSDPLAGCGRASDAHLDPPASLYTCRTDTSYTVAKMKTRYALNIADARYHGVPLADAQANATGLYGHVAPTTINGHAAYHIEYWQFFAFNNQDITILGFGSYGDHEGDWTSVQLTFDRELHRIVQVHYLVHGKSITFAVPATNPTCHDCIVTVKGSNYTDSLPNFFDDQAPYQNNRAEFYIDDLRYKHVVVYIERGGHETWPGPWGHGSFSAGPITFDLNPHDGNGPNYLVPDVKDRLLDMGEVDHPLTEAGKLIMRFDGMWGSTNTKGGLVSGPARQSPVGPALHCSWQWPAGESTVRGCEH